MLGWCESSYSDMTLLLRREGFFSYMILRHDLQIITGNPGARPNNIQIEIMKEIGNLDKKSMKKKVSMVISS